MRCLHLVSRRALYGYHWTLILTFNPTEGERLANEFRAPFLETSAKDKVNVEEAFYSLVREIRRYNREMAGISGTSGISNGGANIGKMDMDQDEVSGGCCKCVLM